MWPLLLARLRVILARNNLHAQLKFIAQMNRDLHEARAARPLLSRELSARLADVRQIELEARAPTKHLRGR